MYLPERILLAGFLTYFVIFIVAPLEPTVPIFMGSIFFVLLCSISFWLGSRFSDILILKKYVRYASRDFILRKELALFYLCFGLGGFGTLVRLFDKYIIRGAGGLSGLEARDALMETSASGLSLVGAALYPFGYIPIFVYLGSKVIPKNRLYFYAALVLFIIPALDALVLFSRSFMLVSLAMIYFGASITFFKGRPLPAQLVLPAIGGIVTVILMSVLVFTWRLDEMQLDVVESIFQSGYGYAIKPNAFALNLFETKSPWSNALSSILPIAQYYTHSMFEFQILWSGADTQVHSYGALHFAPYLKILSILGVQYTLNLWELFPRVGIFTSFFGPLWVDFGWYSMFVMFFLGIVVRHLGRLASSGDVGAYPLYSYFCVVIFFFPMVNFVISAQGMYSITAFTIFFILSRETASYKIRDTA